MELLYEFKHSCELTIIVLLIPSQGNVSFNDNGVRAPNMQRVYQFRNITYGEPKMSILESVFILMLLYRKWNGRAWLV